MERKHYERHVKDEAIRRFFTGESSGKIAREMGIHSSDLIRKWGQTKRKELNLPADYRESSFNEDEDEILRLRTVIARLEIERDTVLQTLTLVTSGKIEGWNGLKDYFIDLNKN